jgi:hypothetical protein
VYENLTGEPDPIFTRTNWMIFNVRPRWTALVVELTWTSGANNQLDGMHLNLAPANESSDPDEHHTKIAVAEGPNQPLRIQLEPGVPHPSADKWPDGSPVYHPKDGGDVFVLVTPRGKLADHTGEVCEPPPDDDKCFLGVGIGFQIEFTVYTTVFYNTPVPAGYTGVPT